MRTIRLLQPRSWTSRLAVLTSVAAALVSFGYLLGPSAEPAGEARLVHEGVGFASGDLLFRRGTGMLSHTVLTADAGSQFSHVGLVLVVDGAPLVIHASPGRSLGSASPVEMESVASFLSPSRASAAALLRPREVNYVTWEKKHVRRTLVLLERRRDPGGPDTLHEAPGAG